MDLKAMMVLHMIGAVDGVNRTSTQPHVLYYASTSPFSASSTVKGGKGDCTKLIIAEAINDGRSVWLLPLLQQLTDLCVPLFHLHHHRPDLLT